MLKTDYSERAWRISSATGGCRFGTTVRRQQRPRISYARKEKKKREIIFKKLFDSKLSARELKKSICSQVLGKIAVTGNLGLVAPSKNVLFRWLARQSGGSNKLGECLQLGPRLSLCCTKPLVALEFLDINVERTTPTATPVHHSLRPSPLAHGSIGSGCNVAAKITAAAVPKNIMQIPFSTTGSRPNLRNRSRCRARPCHTYEHRASAFRICNSRFCSAGNAGAQFHLRHANLQAPDTRCTASQAAHQRPFVERPTIPSSHIRQKGSWEGRSE